METPETKSSIETQVSIRIFARGLLPEEVTTNLGITPDHSHHEGDHPRDDPKYSAYKHGMWILSSKAPMDQPLEVHLDSLLSILEPRGTYIKSLAKQATVDLYCVLYSQSGFQMSPQIMKRMANLSITFGVVVYPE